MIKRFNNIFYFFGGNFFYATAFKSWVGVISDIVGFSPNAQPQVRQPQSA